MKKTKPPHHPEVWAIRFRDGDLSMATFDAIAGRPISIFEARQIALQILARAEQERSRFAEAEYQKMVRAMEGKG